jgi:hypothetical protein
VYWEYKVSNAPTTPRELQIILEREGGEQWELVSTTLMASRLLLLFKRAVEYVEQTIAVEEATTPESSVVEDETYTISETGEEITS